MKFLCLVIDLPRDRYTIITVPTLAERLCGPAAALLTMALGIIALLTLRLALARFIGFVLLFVILAALGELARQPVMGLSQAGLGVAAKLIEFQLRGIYA